MSENRTVEEQPRVKWLGDEWEVDFGVHRYPDGTPALELWRVYPDGVRREDDFAIASVRMPDTSPAPGHVFIKAWSENTGILDALVEGNVIEVIPGVREYSGYVSAPLCRVLIPDAGKVS
jgi:hypothetical protein